MMTGADFPSVLPTPPQCASNPRVPLPPSPALPSESGYQGAPFTGTGPPLCLGCSQPILDQFILQVQGHMWHGRCLRCSVCQTTLSHTCYASNDQLYCHDDFYRLFGAQCASCKNSIPPTEVVRCAHENVYHLDCFRCSACGCLFDTGDEFYLNADGNLLCQTDFNSVQGKRRDENSNPDPSVALMEYYLMESNPSRESLDRLARGLGMEVSQVRAWFRSQRSKDRRKGNNPGNSNIPYLQGAANRVPAPPGGYPLPIVNKVRSPGRLSKSANLPLDTAQIAINQDPGSTHLSAWDELWSNDFVPPNIDLHPDHLKNGEVVRLNVSSHQPPHPSAPVLPPHPSSGAQGVIPTQVPNSGIPNNNNINTIVGGASMAWGS